MGMSAWAYVLAVKDLDGITAYFRDVLGFRGIDVGGGWLIFRTPPAVLYQPMHQMAFKRRKQKRCYFFSCEGQFRTRVRGSLAFTLPLLMRNLFPSADTS